MLFLSCKKDEIPVTTYLAIKNFTIDHNSSNSIYPVGLQPNFEITVSEGTDIEKLKKAFVISGPNINNIQFAFNYASGDTTIVINAAEKLDPLSSYSIVISDSLVSKQGHSLQTPYYASFKTQIDSTDKFPRISDEALLTLIQKKTFTFFWDFGHPYSGMARERNNSGNLVTTGGTGFGIMSIIVGIENNFISRQEGLERITKIVSFLNDKVTRYHGAFPHWLDGNTGATIPFSTKDNGGDLVETSFLMEGMLCALEYFDKSTVDEMSLRQIITKLWEEVEWDWYTKNNSDVLYWHWSPDYNWELNHQIKGWNEALITYILGAASPTHPISPSTYQNGWASNGGIKNGRSYFNYPLPLGYDYGGPLFFEHYSFLGINPTALIDAYANYHLQTVNHSLINWQYCASNPKKFYGYSDTCWGLTASDTRTGYTAHSPTNDLGVITPTAALSSMPYTPEQSLKAARFFYYTLGDKIFKDMGFVDAFSLHYLWFADSFLSIDQGPIIVMIENYKTGLIWNYTMKNKDIKNGLEKLGFSY
ncbi:MAG: beta-glucosidase [Lewinellaceae bacterium]|nr:beta-glucosidase [Lewinellaceae bacterium]